MTLASWESDGGTVLALDGTDGVKVLRGVRGFDGPPIRNTLDSRIGDGAIRVNSRRPERPMSLPLMIDTNVIDVNDVVALFQSGKFVASSGRELTQVVYEDGFEGQWTVDTGGITGLSHRKFTLGLSALDPWWYGPEVSASGTFGSPTAWNAAVAWNAALPWNGGSSTTVTNTGDVATPVTIVIKGAATTASFSSNGVGGWDLVTTIASAAYLSVNGIADSYGPGPHRGPHGHFAGADTAIDWALLSQGSQLFDLPAGASSLIFGVTGSDGSTAWSAYWSPRYYTS